jgi:hypothetical protein
MILRIRRVTFSACKTGLHQRKRAFSGLGLDFGVEPSPSPADRLASPFDGLASPFARLAEKRACAYFSFPEVYPINPTVHCKCILTGLAIFSHGFAQGCHDTASPLKMTPGNIVNSSQNYGLACPSTLSQYVYSVWNQKSPEIRAPSPVDRGLSHDIVAI